MIQKLIALTTLLLLTIGTLKSQQRDIIGTVTSAMDGKTIKNVKIILKGTSIKTKTSINGEYKISVPDDEANVLIYKVRGYPTQEIQIGNRKTVDLILAKELICQRRWPFRKWK